ncbi:hypothetical protein C1924_08650 [Stenotrophomonas sp. ESTM1D_MKCIP4_1]|uniref:chemotaxis protein CheW n=1 Tax=Stenotrophomonas sp. ESTM1D_MKCIP4_1 TaxID=2072414 RepID=UPI000D53D66B|nr:chemotaxis protein CheW [Stenotrophomonas sp. ESTM1D_MKCIP4_1]AWH53243.1 hypothetical protein C1924_08650 [Stenotrophomonas sp. ESTM1D_MKCIP4_1]
MKSRALRCRGRSARWTWPPGWTLPTPAPEPEPQRWLNRIFGIHLVLTLLSPPRRHHGAAAALPSFGFPLQPSSPSAGSPASPSRRFFEYLAVRAGEQWFAVDVQATVEIRGAETFDRPIIDGGPTLTVRDKTLRVSDLRRLSGLTPFTYSCPAMALVRAGVEVIGLAVDEVGEIESVPSKQLRADNPLGYVFCSQSIAMAGNVEIPLIVPMLLIAA